MGPRDHSEGQNQGQVQGKSTAALGETPEGHRVVLAAGVRGATGPKLPNRGGRDGLEAKCPCVVNLKINRKATKIYVSITAHKLFKQPVLHWRCELVNSGCLVCMLGR